jgi:hypothetical protein
MALVKFLGGCAALYTHPYLSPNVRPRETTSNPSCDNSGKAHGWHDTDVWFASDVR